MFTINIDTNSDAFHKEDGSFEIARILRVLAYTLNKGYREGPLCDIHGNTVGDFSLTVKEYNNEALNA